MISSDNNSEEETFWIDNPKQLKLLTSPIRLAIIDSITASQTCSISDLAIDLGVPADSLYYHVKMLTTVGILVKKGVQETSRRDEIIYSLPKKKIRIKYDLDNKENSKLIARIMSSILRSTSKNFSIAFDNPNSNVDGDTRNLRGGQLRGWLDKKDLKEVNVLLERLHDIFGETKREEDRQLHSVTWVLNPLKELPKRRS